MQEIKEFLKLDINALDEVDTITIKQNNANINLLEVSFVNNGENVDLTNANVRAYLILPNKQGDFVDLVITDSTKGLCRLLLKPEYLSKSGSMKLEFIITHKEQTALSKTVIIQIEKSIFNTGSIEISPQYSALIDALGKVNVITSDDTIYIPGPNGKSAYEVAISNGFVGTEEEWLASLKGKDGLSGDADLSDYYDKKEVDKIVSEIQLTPGPKGDKGDQGEKGLDGTPGSKGEKGDPGIDGKQGEDGKSAYQIAVDKGFIGSEESWLESLKGSNDIDLSNYVTKSELTSETNPLDQRLEIIEELINTTLHNVDASLDNSLESLK